MDHAVKVDLIKTNNLFLKRIKKEKDYIELAILFVGSFKEFAHMEDTLKSFVPKYVTDNQDKFSTWCNVKDIRQSLKDIKHVVFKELLPALKKQIEETDFTNRAILIYVDCFAVTFYKYIRNKTIIELIKNPQW